MCIHTHYGKPIWITTELVYVSSLRGAPNLPLGRQPTSHLHVVQWEEVDPNCMQVWLNKFWAHIYIFPSSSNFVKLFMFDLYVVTDMPVMAYMTRSQVTGWNQLEGFTKSSCGNWDLVARSRLPALERGRGSNWEPRD